MNSLKFVVKQWTLHKLYENRNEIHFPVFQRGVVWSKRKMELLIDSILKGIDIPKLYLLRTEKGWDVIDGQQRIRAIVGFFDGEFTHNGDTFEELSDAQKETIEKYKLTITEVEEIDDEEVRLLFTRLQLGVPLNSGEKLNAIKSNLGDFVRKIAKHPLMLNVSIPERRFAKEQVCAQICNNSKVINRTGSFRSSKYEDLENLYRAHKDFDPESEKAKWILSVFNKLYEIFSSKVSEFRNRASIVSIYLMVEEMMIEGELEGNEKVVRRFYLEFLRNIKKQVKLGIDATNRFLINYQSRVIQAADSKTAIIDRQEKLREAFQFYVEHKKIIGFQ